jgi:AcrR family transcriptional regulator
MDNPKYQNIIGTGHALFWKHGIKRVTVEEICREAKVSKMTFYKFFPNKTELAKTIWESVMIDSIARFKNVVDGDLDFQEKVKEMFVIKRQAANNISLEFINDVYKIPELGLQPQIEKYSKETLQIFFNFLKDSQNKGLIRKDIKVEFVIYYFNQMANMFDDEQLVSHYKHPEDLIMEAMRFLFYGLTSKK